MFRKNNYTGRKKSIFRRWWFWALIIILALGRGIEDDNKTDVVEENPSTTNTTNTSRIDESVKKAEAKEEIQPIVQAEEPKSTEVKSEIDTPEMAETISDQDYQFYKSVMNALYANPNRPEDEVIAEIAPSYGMTAEEMNDHMDYIMLAAINREREEIKSKPAVEEMSDDYSLPIPVKDPIPEEIASLIMLILEDSFKDSLEITYKEDDRALIMKPKGEVATSLSMLALMHNNEEYRKSYDYMVESLAGMSKSMADSMAKGVTLMITNPLNDDNVLIAIIDGVVFYNAVNDF